MKFSVALRGALTVLVTAGLMAVPVAAHAEADGSVPDAPTGFSNTGGGLKDSANPAAGSVLDFAWSASAEHGSPVTGYQMQRSVDGGATWQDDPAGTVTGTEATVDRAPTGKSWLHRVEALSAVGRSAASTVETVASPQEGVTTQRFVIRTSDGAPLTAGTVSWWNGYDDTTWSKPYRLSADGVVAIPQIPAGYGYSLRMENAYLQTGVEVVKTFDVNPGTEPQTLIVPAPPVKRTQLLHIALPNGVPVANAEFDAQYYDALIDTVAKDGFFYYDHDGAAVTGRTDASGTAVLRGWSAAGVQFVPASQYPYPQQAVIVHYDDGTLHEEKTVLLDGADTTVELNPVPWVTNSTPDPATTSTTTGVSFVAHGAPAAAAQRSAGMSAHRASGFKVTVTPPSGWTSKGCTKKPVLTGTTDSAGRVRLSVCGSKSGYLKVKSPGAVNTGSILLRVRGAAPMSPSRIVVVSRAAGQVTVGWTKPAYNGGYKVTSYKVTVSAPGHASHTVVLKTSSLTKFHHTFTGLARAEAWTASVRAITSRGTGSARAGSVRTV